MIKKWVRGSKKSWRASTLRHVLDPRLVYLLLEDNERERESDRNHMRRESKSDWTGCRNGEKKTKYMIETQELEYMWFVRPFAFDDIEWFSCRLLSLSLPLFSCISALGICIVPLKGSRSFSRVYRLLLSTDSRSLKRGDGKRQFH